jgi:monofunctional biosynthetic peptidoglycan transglycosylase
MKKPSLIRRLNRWLKKILFTLLLFQFGYIIILCWVDPPITITQAESLLDGDGLRRDYVAFDEISSSAKLAVIAAEDQLFPVHNGFDWKAIEKAINHNRQQKSIRGASTLSQQVAKNVFLWQGRGWIRKGLEVYFTFMIELIWGKERILEVYLNVVEMGRGIYGIEAAAQTYFNKPASMLTQSESAVIASCLPNPKLYTIRPMSRYVSLRHHWVAIQMGNLRGDSAIDQLLKQSAFGGPKRR